MDSHGKELLIIAHEKLGKWRSQKLGCHSQTCSPDRDKGKALLKHIFKLIMVSGTVVVADNRGTSNGISKEYSDKYKVYIHDCAVGSHTIFARDFHKLHVVE